MGPPRHGAWTRAGFSLLSAAVWLALVACACALLGAVRTAAVGSAELMPSTETRMPLSSFVAAHERVQSGVSARRFGFSQMNLRLAREAIAKHKLVTLPGA